MGKQGDTLRVPCTKPMEVEVKVNGWFGKPRLVVQPGERYNASRVGSASTLKKSIKSQASKSHLVAPGVAGIQTA